MKSQMASPTFSNIYAALVAIINTKFPELGELLLTQSSCRCASHVSGLYTCCEGYSCLREVDVKAPRNSSLMYVHLAHQWWQTPG